MHIDAKDVLAHGADAYAASLRPQIAALLRAAGLDVVYVRGAGDVLVDVDGRHVVDFAGGFGTTLLGHHPPRVVRAVRACLDEGVPFAAQMSVRARAGRAGALLAERLHQDTGAPWRVFFVSTGAEAVEAGLTLCALVQRDVQRTAGQRADVQRADVQRAELQGSAVHQAVMEPAPTAGPADAAAGVDAAARAPAPMQGRHGQGPKPPAFLVVEGCYHGRTAGAAGLSQRSLGFAGLPARKLAARVVVVPRNDVDAAAAAVSALVADGCVLAGVFAEPVQGEGGVFPLSSPFLQALERHAHAHGALFVSDEIQCGLGRTGRFVAAAQCGVVPDALLLGKALGGGLTKVAALCVRADRVDATVLAELELEATSTFADDDFGAAAVAATAAAIDADGVVERCARAGEALRLRLAEVHERFPRVVRAVRGRGLLVGVELDVAGLAASTSSPLLRVLCEGGHLAGVVAGHVLREGGVRVAPTLAHKSVLRLAPSAFISEGAIEQLGAALTRACAAVDVDDVSALVSPIIGRPPTRPPTRLPAARPAPTLAPPSPAPPAPPAPMGAPIGGRAAGRPRVAFLAAFADVDDLVRFEPRLVDFSLGERAAFLSRVLPVLEPFVGGRTHLRFDDLAAPAAHAGVDVVAIGVPFLAGDAMRALRDDPSSLPSLKRLLNRAIARARDEGCTVVGFGGHTSIVAAAVGVDADGVVATNGSALTAVAAVDAGLAACAARGTAERSLRVGVVGAAGSIGAALVAVFAARVGAVVAVGRPGSERRLAQTRDHALAFAAAGSVVADVVPAVDVAALRGCDLVITASNAARPIVSRADVDAGAVVVDVAVPGDVAVDVDAAAGGLVRVPRSARAGLSALAALDLGDGLIHGCLGETLLLGLAGSSESALSGSPSPARLVHLRALAQRFGVAVDELKPRARVS